MQTMPSTTQLKTWGEGDGNPEVVSKLRERVAQVGSGHMLETEHWEVGKWA